jgi:hypothetical protein
MLGSQWRYVLDMMPADLERSAAAKLALVRHREICEAGDLLRLALAYGLCDYSLRQTAAWATLAGIGQLSDVGVMKRVQGAADWLAHLVMQWLLARGLTTAVPPLQVRIVDATVICEPGSKGTDWRLHLGLDLAHQRIVGAELTGPKGGETLSRHHCSPGEILLGDRGYAHHAGVAHTLQAAAHAVVRINWHNFPLETPAGAPLDLVACLELLGADEIGDWSVQFRHEGQVYSMRLIALRKSLAAAEKEQHDIRHEARRTKRQADSRSLRAAHFTYLLTDLPPARLSAADALELYRLRWQIEIAFKRLKSLLHLDHLRAKNEKLAATYLYAKLLGALIIDELYHQAESFFPWGYSLFGAALEPVADVAAAA